MPRFGAGPPCFVVECCGKVVKQHGARPAVTVLVPRAIVTPLKAYTTLGRVAAEALLQHEAVKKEYVCWLLVCS